MAKKTEKQEADAKEFVLLDDVIIGEVGRRDAGSTISSSEVSEGTLRWLLNQKMIRSVDEIEAEADANDGNEQK